MRTARPAWIVTLVLLATAWPGPRGGVAAADPPADKPSATASAPMSQPAPALLTDADRDACIELIPPLAPDAEAEQKLRTHRERLETALRAQTDDEQRITLALGIANWELADVAAPAATRYLLGFQTRQDLDRLAAVARTARQAIDEATAALDALPKTDDRVVERRRERTHEQAERLRAFANAFAALGGSAPADADELKDAREACRDAALDLAELREVEDVDVVAAAKLWQAVMLQAGGRTDRALTMLDTALKTPTRMPYEFFQRVWRCTIHTQQGEYALAAGLLIRAASLCEAWMRGEADGAAPRAVRTLVAARILCERKWAASLGDTDAARAKALETAVAALSKKTFGRPASRSLYELQRAIPMLVEIPPEALAEPRPPTETAPTATEPTTTEPAATEPAEVESSTTQPAATESSEPTSGEPAEATGEQTPSPRPRRGANDTE